MGPRLLVVALARTGRWTARNFPVVDAAGASAWPARWTRERIEQRRLELGEFRFRRQYLCEEVDDSGRRFKREWLRRGLQRGRGWGPFPGLDTTTLPPGSRTFSGVDLAVSREAGSDLSAIATIAVFPTNGDRLLVNVESGRWSAPEILRRVVDAHERYSSTLIVEANAAQDYLRQMLLAEHPGLPVIAHTTTAASKFDAVWDYEAMAVEFERARWIVPATEASAPADAETRPPPRAHLILSAVGRARTHRRAPAPANEPRIPRMEAPCRPQLHMVRGPTTGGEDRGHGPADRHLIGGKVCQSRGVSE